MFVDSCNDWPPTAHISITGKALFALPLYSFFLCLIFPLVCPSPSLSVYTLSLLSASRLISRRLVDAGVTLHSWPHSSTCFTSTAAVINIGWYRGSRKKGRGNLIAWGPVFLSFCLVVRLQYLYPPPPPGLVLHLLYPPLVRFSFYPLLFLDIRFCLH